MKTHAQCLSCMVTQVVNAMRFGKYDEDLIYGNTCRLLDSIRTYSKEDSPAYNSSLALCEIYRLIENDDPFYEVKEISNREAQVYYPYLERIVNEASDNLLMSFQASVVGNIIDLGIRDSYNIKQELQLGINTGFSRSDYPDFRKKLQKVDSVLILADNSGEIVFDKLLVKELLALGKKVTYMVKGEPILNDAVMKDAVETGMTQLTEVVTTGAKLIGFERHVVSAHAVSVFDAAPLVIAKGMANFETLGSQTEARGKTFCILKAKCDLVAAETGVALNDLVFIAL
ncbi:MAG: DUF89 family protein [Ruminococcaceae bacterium]|nr:DUF89 family protein [Oscillospiraceae bacterium]